MQKNIVKFIVLFLALVSVFYFMRQMSNNTSQQKQAVDVAENLYETTLPKDFYPFYDQFHSDSTFQLNHIMFPLKGLTPSQDSTKIAEEIFWQKENWVIHRPFDNQDGTFERTFTNIQGIITEQISANDGLFTLQKRYTKLNEEWYLIYYQDLLMH